MIAHEGPEVGRLPQKDPSSRSLGPADGEDVEHVPSFFRHEESVLATLLQLQADLAQATANARKGAARGGEPKEDADRVATYETLFKVLDEYQENALVLDRQMEALVGPLMALVRDAICEWVGRGTDAEATRTAFSGREGADGALARQLELACRYVYRVCKVRGYKVTLRFFTHEPRDLEPVLEFLGLLPGPSEAPALWELRYVLLLWLSLIAMVPFDLRRLDSGGGGLLNRAVAAAEPFLATSGKEADGAAVAIARLLTRRDAADALAAFLAKSVLEATQTDSIFVVNGLLATLCYVFKFGLRDLLLPSLDATLPLVQLYRSAAGGKSALLRKRAIKLAQRVAKCFLRQRVATWRYQMSRKAVMGLGDAGKAGGLVAGADTDDDADDSVPEQLDDLVDLLLTALADKDTIVRWSAAKGIGQVCFRLPREFAQQVVGSVLELFEQDLIGSAAAPDTSAVSHTTWHGACLALAELARRGLLLPERLDAAVRWVGVALAFDQPRLSHAVGAQVRDAAAYVAWSFARAYAPAVMADHVATLAPALVVAAVFDREVHVRRAAAAAFQENVGRQGVFPNGISIVTTADYFSLGNRAHAFLQVAPEVGRFLEYRPRLVEHLVGRALSSWDASVRLLAAESLGAFAALDPALVFGTAVPRLVAILNDAAHGGAASPDARHGALLGLAYAFLAWSKLEKRAAESANVRGLVAAAMDAVAETPAAAWVAFGCERVREAVATLGACLLCGGFGMSDGQAAALAGLVAQNLGEQDLSVVSAAVRCVAALEHVDASHAFSRVVGSQRDSWLEAATGTADVGAARGFTLALGALPARVLSGEAFSVKAVAELCAAARPDTAVKRDTESRRNAVEAVAQILGKAGNTGVEPGIVQEMLLACLGDYTSDARGDVGSIVREASMDAAAALIACVWAPEDMPDAFLDALVGGVVQQAAEKIDRVRRTAGASLGRIVRALDAGGRLRPESREALVRVAVDSPPDWLAAAEVFPALVPLLALDEYRTALLTGLVVSAGALTESLARSAGDELRALVQKLEQGPAALGWTLGAFCSSLLNLFSVHHRDDRVIVPLLELVDALLQGLLLVNVADPPGFYVSLASAVYRQVERVRNVKRVLAAVRVFASMLFLCESEPARDAVVFSLKRLLQYLVHPFPKVREQAASLFYVAVVSSGLLESAGGDADELSEEFERVISGTSWARAVEQLKPVQQQLQALFLRAGCLPVS